MRILITAGPTREFLDPVRFLSNRSTGRMGYALSEVAAQRGHDVTLVSGPVAIPAPEHVTLVNVISARDMLAAVLAHLAHADVLIMSAAVADWRPKIRSLTKLKKRDMNPIIELEPNPDILASVKALKGDKIIIGFAAETHDVDEEARAKLERKGLDMIVANDVTQPGAGFEVDTNIVTLIPRTGDVVKLPLQSKTEVAEKIIAWTEAYTA